LLCTESNHRHYGSLTGDLGLENPLLLIFLTNHHHPSLSTQCNHLPNAAAMSPPEGCGQTSFIMDVGRIWDMKKKAGERGTYKVHHENEPRMLIVALFRQFSPHSSC
jgi:hypothetical protein